MAQMVQIAEKIEITYGELLERASDIQRLTLAQFRVALARLFRVPTRKLTWEMMYLVFWVGRGMLQSEDFLEDIRELTKPFTSTYALKVAKAIQEDREEEEDGDGDRTS